jgi:tetratricopeptide (TPR) repeat protein
VTSQPLKTIVLDLLQQGHRDEAAFVRELSETERTVIGTPHLWSAKDHLAHRTFWRQDLIGKVTAILQHRGVPSDDSEESINARVFDEHKRHPWSEIHAESERVHAELLALVEQLSEDDLTASNRFAWISGQWPSYAVVLADCYEHDQAHLAQYYSDRHDLPRAIQIREQCVNRVLQAEVAARVKGHFLYNLACFYAQQNQLDKAAARLQEAVALDPGLQARSKRDPELVALGDHTA